MVAPDYPGFGLSDPLPDSPTFDRLAQVTAEVLDTLGVNRYSLYLFDFGAPVGFRVALGHDERVLLDTGHFALEEETDTIATAVDAFLTKPPD